MLSSVRYLNASLSRKSYSVKELVEQFNEQLFKQLGITYRCLGLLLFRLIISACLLWITNSK